MLESLHLRHVGPAPEMKLELAPRLNLLTGDNGLGKTLLLDCAWHALTRTWPATWSGRGVVPVDDGASIEWVERRNAATIRVNASYDFEGVVWKAHTVEESPHRDQRGGGLVVYLRVDGGISVHDPLRLGEQFRLPARQRSWGQSHSFQFREQQVWDGLSLDDGESDRTQRVCEGLIRDVVRWSVEPGNKDFEALAMLIEALTGVETFRLTREVRRVFVDDALDFPILAGPAGEIALPHAPAGLRRILSLAYLVVWAWREHRLAAGLKKVAPSDSLVLLIDEVEGHLHPRWQRTILPSLVRSLGDTRSLQVIASTHSPLVLASAEPFFDADRDAWFDLDLENGRVELRKRPYVRHGEVGNWLTSDAFDLAEPRSFESETAIREALALARSEAPEPADIDRVDALLRASLGDTDRFWLRWTSFRDDRRASGRTTSLGRLATEALDEVRARGRRKK